jgi:hypothetical protein
MSAAKKSIATSDPSREEGGRRNREVPAFPFVGCA